MAFIPFYFDERLALVVICVVILQSKPKDKEQCWGATLNNRRALGKV